MEKIINISMASFSALLFTLGGICMGYSEGLTKTRESLLVYLFFIAAATVETIVIYRTSLGLTYIYILGVEAIFTAIFSAYLFKESYSPLKLAAVAVVVFGVIMLQVAEELQN
jgi:multidrug transporter EmrE-like cation transporter